MGDARPHWPLAHRVAWLFFALTACASDAGATRSQSPDGAEESAAPANDPADAATDRATVEPERSLDIDAASEQDSTVDVALDNAASPAEATPTELPLCLRLRDPDHPDALLDLSRFVGEQYRIELGKNCEVRKVLHPHSAVAFVDWSNRLYNWNLALWGCGSEVADTFELLNGDIQRLTSNNAQKLIALYLGVARTRLELNDGEEASLRRTLEHLALPMITEEPGDDALSECGAAPAASGGDGPGAP